MTAIVFGMKNYNTLAPDAQPEYEAAVSILYGGLQRLAWGLAIAWLVFACHMGYGGMSLRHPTRPSVLDAVLIRSGHTPQVETQRCGRAFIMNNIKF